MGPHTIAKLSKLDLAAATVNTENSVGVDSDAAKRFRAEVDRRTATDKGFAAYVAKARRLSAVIAAGADMDYFHEQKFSRDDRQLALALGAKGRRFIRMAKNQGFNAWSGRLGQKK